jgi:hypothetical protein
MKIWLAKQQLQGYWASLETANFSNKEWRFESYVKGNLPYFLGPFQCDEVRVGSTIYTDVKGKLILHEKGGFWLEFRAKDKRVYLPS